MSGDGPVGWRERWERARAPLAGVLGVCVVAAGLLTAMGRGPWCKCASPVPWSWDIWSMHNSQHVLDPYTFSHVLHGVVFFGLLHLIARGRWPRARIVVAAAMEAAWELLENTEQVIQHYRETTISLDYHGDSVANSVSDILFCTGGYLFAAAVPGWVAAASFVLTELLLLAWIRDSLVVNVIMLVWPIEAIKTWQSGE